MNEKKLLNYAIIISITGILTLFLIGTFSKIAPTPIEKIDDTYFGKTVRIDGNITKVQNKGNITLIFIENSKTELVVFSEINVTKGKNISAIGKVEEYNDGIQINVDTLKYI